MEAYDVAGEFERWRAAHPREWFELQAQLARENLLPFTQATFQEFEQSWHHSVICDALDLVARGVIRRLMVFAPPRHGKTELFQRRFPAFVLGRNPDFKIIASSYSQELAQASCVDVQNIMTHPLYANVFPDVRLPRQGVKMGMKVRTRTKFDLHLTRGGYRSSGIGGPITGFGFNLGLIDDPIKNRQEAESPTKRDAHESWYTSTFYTRMDRANAGIVISLTRWHHDDLAGRLLKKAQADPAADQWVVIILPALFEEGMTPVAGDRREPGEALWPDRFPVEHLMRVKANAGPYDWEALYQQRPFPPGGNKIKVSMMKSIDRLDVPASVRWVNYTDLAVSTKTSADFTVNGFLGIDNVGNLYLRDVLRGRWEWPDARELLLQRLITERKLKKWRGAIGFEKAGQQEGFIDDLNREPRARKNGITFRKVEVDRDKLTRALGWIAKVANGQFFVVEGAWNNDFIAECSLFTGLGDAHDDQIDMVSGAYELLADATPGTAELLTRPGNQRGAQQRYDGYSLEGG